VVVSFISFFIKMDAILARMTLLIVTSVTMVAHAVFTTFRLALPSVPYYTALDVWSTVCFAFVFLTIIEFALVAGFSRKKPAPCENNSNSLAMDHDVSIIATHPRSNEGLFICSTTEVFSLFTKSFP
jgi:hypothetical protein